MRSIEGEDAMLKSSSFVLALAFLLAASQAFAQSPAKPSKGAVPPDR